MTIHLPKDVESSINAAVQSGRFASADDMVAEIVRDYFRHKQQPSATPSSGLGSIGAMRDAADELDEIVADAMKRREQRGAAASAHKPIWEVAAELRKNVPSEEWEKLPVDGASQHDHYIYGTPKRPTQ